MTIRVRVGEPAEWSEEAADPEVFLADQLDNMRRLLAELEVLADNLHVAGREERAAAISRFLLAMFPEPANDEHPLIAAFDGAPGECEALPRRDQMPALVGSWAGSLRSVVFRGVYEIAMARFPAEPERFVASALLLCQILRAHIRVMEGAMPPCPRPAPTPAHRGGRLRRRPSMPYRWEAKPW